MLTKDDLKQMKQIIREAVRPLDEGLERVEKSTTSLDLRLERVERITEETRHKVDDLGEKVGELSDKVVGLAIETKGIHLILERQEKDIGERIDRLEEQAGINN